MVVGLLCVCLLAMLAATSDFATLVHQRKISHVSSQEGGDVTFEESCVPACAASCFHMLLSHVAHFSSRLTARAKQCCFSPDEEDFSPIITKLPHGAVAQVSKKEKV